MTTNTSRAITRKLKRFYTLPSPQQRLFLESVVWLTLATLFVHAVPTRFWQKLLGTRKSISPPPRQPTEQIQQGPLPSVTATRMLRLAAVQLPWRPVCLPQAIALKWMLHLRHQHCLLVLGVSGNGHKDGNQAHAWVTAQGRVLIGGPVKHYTPICYFD